MKIIKKILGGLVNFAMLLIIIFAIFVTIISLTSDDNKVSKIGKYIPLNVKTDSMDPTIKKGDFVVVEECDISKLKKGDVIAFFTNVKDQVIIKTHRIIQIHGEDSKISFITQGDNVEVNDSIPVYPNDIVGKWDNVRIPKAGTVLDFVTSKLGFLFVIVVPLLILFIYQIYKFIVVIIEEKNNSKKEKEDKKNLTEM